MTAHEDYARERARLLLGCYRTIGANDLPKYVMGLTIVLTLFSEPVIAEATSPATGIQTRLTWPPNPAELRAFCEAIAERQTELPPDFAPKPFSRHYKEPNSGAPSAADRNRVAEALRRFRSAIKPIPKPERRPWTAPTDDELRAHYGRRPLTEPIPFD